VPHPLLGNAEDLVELAARNVEAIGAGHSFIVYLRDGYPVNVLNALKQVPEVCNIYCATANPVEVLLAQTDLGEEYLASSTECRPPELKQRVTPPIADSSCATSGTNSRHSKSKRGHSSHDPTRSDVETWRSGSHRRALLGRF